MGQKLGFERFLFTLMVSACSGLSRLICVSECGVVVFLDIRVY